MQEKDGQNMDGCNPHLERVNMDRIRILLPISGQYVMFMANRYILLKMWSNLKSPIHDSKWKMTGNRWINSAMLAITCIGITLVVAKNVVWLTRTELPLVVSPHFYCFSLCCLCSSFFYFHVFSAVNILFM